MRCSLPAMGNSCGLHVEAAFFRVVAGFRQAESLALPVEDPPSTNPRHRSRLCILPRQVARRPTLTARDELYKDRRSATGHASITRRPRVLVGIDSQFRSPDAT